MVLLLAIGAVFWNESHQPWQTWIARYDVQPNSTPMPIQIQALVPTQTGKPELCVTCHVGIKDISASHPAQAFGCVVCHGGEPLALDKDRAHSTMRGGRNPSDLSVATQSCGQSNCHGGYADEEQNHVDRVLKSMQATYAGGIAHVRFSFGAQNSPIAQFGIRAVNDTSNLRPPKALPSLSMYSTSAPTGTIDAKMSSCLNGGCHLWTKPSQPQVYTYRSSGCAACHYVYADDGVYRGNDPTIPNNEPGHGVAHQLTTAIPFSQCDHCHNRSNYNLKSMAFDWREDLPPMARPLSSLMPPEGRRLIEYYQPIADFTKCEYELNCVDCHTAQEAMGDGHIYGSKKDAQHIQCQTCHGTLTTMPKITSIVDANELAMRQARINGHPEFLKVGDQVITTERGELLWSIKQTAPNKFVQVDKVTGQIYNVPLVKGSGCTQDGKTQTSDYCHTCHSVVR
ncbi:MAG: cytochrome c3 family protein [Chloroflexi bacterium]|nr:cytochrome c3 family protein [Chloroflexota bacterium]